ncbi:DNA polymerase I [Thermodesulfovibrio thiophilus]|uniref:DNA polymerase I n=1 Tax=Thermodesulfovibrio thiophilus TaxID=340095 RepID=UPI00041E7203|nr:DNA polymerase I [Thermodesulfovibrio thiophilus]
MDEIYLLDGSCFVYRAYHAIKALITSRGFPTNAIYGFIRMLLKLLKEKDVQYLLIAFDSPHPTKRHIVYEDYKITRPETPGDLPIQLEQIKKIIDAFGIKRIEIPGYEADDIIATVVLNLNNQSITNNIFIVSLDKDMLQLVSDNVKIYDPFSNLIIDRDYVIKKYGIPPEKLNDFMAFTGDSIDNIPGVKGIGEKTAAELMKRYGSVEAILKNLDIIKPARVAELIRKNIDSLKFSRELVALKSDAPIKLQIDDIKIKEQDNDKLTQLFQEFEFSTLLKEVVTKNNEIRNSDAITTIKAGIERILEKIHEKGVFTLTLTENKSDIFKTTSKVINSKDDYTINIGINGDIYEVALQDSKVNKILSLDALKIVYNAKEILKKLKHAGMKLYSPYFDIMIAAYLINPNRGKYNFNEITLEFLGKLYDSLESSNLIMFELYEKLHRELKEKELERLYFDIEMPLIDVLFEMEEAGIKINIDKLEALTKQISFELDKLREKIYGLAGAEFNINSPKQLSEVLYDKLGLKSRKRGKKARSTEMEVLEELSVQHELPQEVINYRTLNKLLTGYLLPLKDHINPATNRIHTKWSQTVAGTGRIVSSEPNLQNIPVKGQWAQLLREVFVPEDGFLFLSADYSQIELRLLAHLSEDPALIRAFKEGKDIHNATASEIFSVNENDVTEEQRRIAKTVNFGISYGISPFGLSESIKIPYEKAQELIDLYFLRYPQVKKFIEESIEFAKENGYVKTLFGRIRPVSEINSQNQFLRSQAERIAVNARVQGTAADIIKIAMVKIHNRIRQEMLNAKIILQIHDEIVLEVKEQLLGRVSDIVQNEMKDFNLKVPLEVNVFTGKSLNL